MVRKIVDARADKDGVITHVRFEGNQRDTAVSRAVPIVEREKTPNAHVVHPNDGRPAFLLKNPDGKKCNNLDEMAKR
jgi:hypothetical protein